MKDFNPIPVISSIRSFLLSFPVTRPIFCYNSYRYVKLRLLTYCGYMYSAFLNTTPPS